MVMINTQNLVDSNHGYLNGGANPSKSRWKVTCSSRRKEEPNYSGHNPVAALSYFLFVFCGSFFMIITGLAMYSENNPGGFTDTFFGWVMPVFGSTEQLHNIHHLVAWIFPVFFILHFYAILRHDFVDYTSVMSSMVTGYKRNVKESTDLTN